MGCHCGTAGRAVASDTRAHRFKSSDQHFFINNIDLLLTIEKKKPNKKSLRMPQ